jgi:hypothetical protein
VIFVVGCVVVVGGGGGGGLAQTPWCSE